MNINFNRRAIMSMPTQGWRELMGVSIKQGSNGSKDVTGDNITITRQLVTPELAEHWLTLNKHNRRVSKLLVDKYARDMKHGRWADNGETIKFRYDGVLVDGQHRLMAIKSSGTTIMVTVVKGLPNDAFETVDLGRSRKASDIFGMAGEVNCHTLSGALRWQYKYEQNRWADGQSNNLSVGELQDLLDRHPGMRQAIVDTHKVSKVMPSSVSGFLMYQFGQRDKELAMEFFEGVRGGANLKAGNPILTFRNRIFLQTGTKINRLWVIAYAIKAWNALRTGKSIYQLRWRSAGNKDEPMPEIL